eukprot:scaffold896_cov58-Attheya_sp.AAC.4
MPEIRGDLSAHRFWTRGTTAMFNIWVTDMECPSQCGSDPGVILKRHEAEKKRKYVVHCERHRKHFTPLAILVNGMMGVECDVVRKRLTSRLSTKSMPTYNPSKDHEQATKSQKIARFANTTIAIVSMLPVPPTTEGTMSSGGRLIGSKNRRGHSAGGKRKNAGRPSREGQEQERNEAAERAHRLQDQRQFSSEAAALRVTEAERL